MRIVTIELPIYSVGDLKLDDNVKIKHAVIEKHFDINLTDEWWDSDYEILDKLKKLKFQDIDFKFSGFYSQGDGASITCNINITDSVNIWHKDFKKHFKKHRKARPELLNAFIKQIKNKEIDTRFEVFRCDNRYLHQNTLSWRINYFDEDFLNLQLPTSTSKETYSLKETFLNWIYDYLFNFIQEASVELFRKLQSNYYYLTSAVAILETLDYNEYEFHENGDIFTNITSMKIAA